MYLKSADLDELGHNTGTKNWRGFSFGTMVYDMYIIIPAKPQPTPVYGSWDIHLMYLKRADFGPFRP